MEKNFNLKIKPILKYVGTIGAILMGIAYIAIVFIMVFGFNANANLAQSITFALINAIIGLIIMQFLKVQGITLAKEIEENREILKEYYNTKTKDKKAHSIKYFWITSVTKDAIVKGLSISATTLGIIYIVIRGSSDYSYLLLALVNLIMFTCFGILSLVKAYDFFNEEHIPFIKEKINETKTQKERKNTIENKDKESLEMVTEKPIEQTNDRLHNSRGIDILEPSNNYNPTSDSMESVVVDSNNCDNSILGRPIHTGNNASDCIDNFSEENS